ncbi:MAG: hypothetical protein LQ350_006959, partial [Teloschistes chrysophthalmus]
HSPPPADDDDDEEPLPDLIDITTEPVTIRGKGRPKGSLKKRQQTFENSSQREPSGFERVDAAMVAQRGGGGRGRGRGRERGRRGRQASQRGATGLNSAEDGSIVTSSVAAQMNTPSGGQGQRGGRGGGRGGSNVRGVPSSFTSSFTFAMR